MIQTTLEITFSDDNFAGVTVETNADGELKLQAELVGFAHLAATVISSLGRERARALVRSLADGGFADDELRLEESSGGTLWIAASFLDARRGPRLFFELKPRDLRRIGKDPDVACSSLGARGSWSSGRETQRGRRDCRAGEGDRCPDRESRRERVRPTRDGIRRLFGNGRPCLGGCRSLHLACLPGLRRTTFAARPADRASSSFGSGRAAGPPCGAARPAEPVSGSAPAVGPGLFQMRRGKDRRDCATT